ncbi:MAG: ParB/RepB/Spo0J family partition protein [Balneolaceae bacterium]
MSKKVLGRGLGAFFPEYGDDSKETDKRGENVKTAVPLDPAEKVNVVLNIPVDHIRPNPHQPRKEFDEEALEQLASSIRQHGLIQPITVRYLGEKRFELISGERRLRASKLAGLQEIPSYIREVDDEQIIAFALIENIQRVDLSPLEVAMGYHRLMEELQYTQSEVAEKVGKNRTTVTNMLRLLALPDFIQAALRDESISAGHARALINLKSERDQKKLLQLIVEKGLSVRDVEEHVRTLEKKNEQQPSGKRKQKGEENPFLKQISERLKETFSTRVDIKSKKKGGEIRISYYSDDDLERILQLMESMD